MKKWLKSRKFWATLTGVLTCIGHKAFGIDPQVVEKLVVMLSAYVIGQGVADRGKASAEVH